MSPPHQWGSRDVMARRWADLSDSEVGDDQLDELIVAVRVENDHTTCVAMCPHDTVGRLSSYTEARKGLARDSLSLSHNGIFLTRRQTIGSIDSRACVLQLITRRLPDGRLRGSFPATVSQKHDDVPKATRGSSLEFPQATGAVSADARCQWRVSGSLRHGQDNNSHRDASRAVQWNI